MTEQGGGSRKKAVTSDGDKVDQRKSTMTRRRWYLTLVETKIEISHRYREGTVVRQKPATDRLATDIEKAQKKSR